MEPDDVVLSDVHIGFSAQSQGAPRESTLKDYEGKLDLSMGSDKSMEHR